MFCKNKKTRDKKICLNKSTFYFKKSNPTKKIEVILKFLLLLKEILFKEQFEDFYFIIFEKTSNFLMDFKTKLIDYIINFFFYKIKLELK